MTRHRTISRRLARVEAVLAAIVAVPAPSVVRVRVGAETREEAIAVHRSRYPTHRGPLLIVPRQPRSDTESAEFARRFKEQQREIVKAVRRSYSHAADEIPVVNALYTAPRMSKIETKTKPWKPGVR